MRTPVSGTFVTTHKPFVLSTLFASPSKRELLGKEVKTCGPLEREHAPAKA